MICQIIKKVLLVLILLYFSVAQAQTSDTGNVQNTEEGVILNFQNTDILALIDLVSEVTGKNFIVDPRVNAKVTVYSGSALDDKQIYDVFLSILDVYNLSAIEVGDIVKVIPVAGSKQAPLPTTSGNSASSSDGLVTQVYKLQHATAADILPVIRPLIPAESHVAIHPRSGTLVFTDTEANVKRVLDILSYLDIAENTFNIRIIPLKHALATDLKEAVSVLIGGLVSDSAAGPNGDAGTSNRKATVHAEIASNSLIINGSDEAFAIISSLVASLDVERPKTKDVHVVKLKYANAADMSGILNDVAQKLSPTSGAANAADQQQAVSVQVHEPSNTLIIHANQPDFLALKSVIDQIDVRRKQVFIEAIIAEVSFNNSADLGIEWQANLDARGGGTAGTDFADITGGLNVGFVNNLVLNQIGAVVPDLNVILGALRNDSTTNILSTPTLLTVDNEEAEIVVGQEVPFITGQFTTDNTVATNTVAADGTTTPAINPFQTIERRDIGLRLTVTPRVNTEGLITMDVEQEISNVSAINVQGAADLITDERRITATVQVQSGKILVIGGLIQDDIFKTDQRVPLLGDIPVLGNLFKRRQDNKVKTNLMVFLRPKIIDEEQSIAKETVERYEYIRNLNLKENARKDGLIGNKNIRSLPPIESYIESDEPIEFSLNTASDSELIEMLWRYSLPENSHRTESRF